MLTVVAMLQEVGCPGLGENGRLGVDIRSNSLNLSS